MHARNGLISFIPNVDANQNEIFKSDQQFELESISPKIEILLIFSCPHGSSPLRLQREEREIRDSFKNSSSSKKINIDVLPACRVDDLCGHLLRHRNKYDVVHFSGHADRTSAVVRDLYTQMESQNGAVDETEARRVGVLHQLEAAADRMIGAIEQEQKSEVVEKMDGLIDSMEDSASLLGSKSSDMGTDPLNNSISSIASDPDNQENFVAHRRRSRQFKLELTQLSVPLQSGELVSVDVTRLFSRSELRALGVGSLVFESERPGGAALVSLSALAELLRLHQREALQCVVLNACGSRFQADSLTQASPYTVCFDGRVSDEQSALFSRGFYTALAAGLSFHDSFYSGKCRMEMLSSQSSSVSVIPSLLVNDELVSMYSRRVPRFKLGQLLEVIPDTAPEDVLYGYDGGLTCDSNDVNNIQLVQANEALRRDNAQLRSVINYGMGLLQQRDGHLADLHRQLTQLTALCLSGRTHADGGGVATVSGRRLLIAQTLGSPSRGKSSRKQVSISVGRPTPRSLRRSGSAPGPYFPNIRYSQQQESSSGRDRKNSSITRWKIAFGRTTPATLPSTTIEPSQAKDLTPSPAHPQSNNNSLPNSASTSAAPSRRGSMHSAQGHSLSSSSKGSHSLSLAAAAHDDFHKRPLSRPPSGRDVLRLATMEALTSPGIAKSVAVGLSSVGTASVSRRGSSKSLLQKPTNSTVVATSLTHSSPQSSEVNAVESHPSDRVEALTESTLIPVTTTSLRYVHTSTTSTATPCAPSKLQHEFVDDLDENCAPINTGKDGQLGTINTATELGTIGSHPLRRSSPALLASPPKLFLHQPQSAVANSAIDHEEYVAPPTQQQHLFTRRHSLPTLSEFVSNRSMKSAAPIDSSTSAKPSLSGLREFIRSRRALARKEKPSAAFASSVPRFDSEGFG